MYSILNWTCTFLLIWDVCKRWYYYGAQTDEWRKREREKKKHKKRINTQKTRPHNAVNVTNVICQERSVVFFFFFTLTNGSLIQIIHLKPKAWCGSLFVISFLFFFFFAFHRFRILSLIKIEVKVFVTDINEWALKSMPFLFTIFVVTILCESRFLLLLLLLPFTFGVFTFCNFKTNKW